MRQTVTLVSLSAASLSLSTESLSFVTLSLEIRRPAPAFDTRPIRSGPVLARRGSDTLPVTHLHRAPDLDSRCRRSEPPSMSSRTPPPTRGRWEGSAPAKRPGPWSPRRGRSPCRSRSPPGKPAGTFSAVIEAFRATPQWHENYKVVCRCADTFFGPKRRQPARDQLARKLDLDRELQK